MSGPTSVKVQHWLEMLKSGDDAACNELIECSCHRLQAIVARTLARFPGVRRFERESDVLQNALLRIRTNLLRLKLKQEQPMTPREFFSLSSCWIRDEVISLLRHYYGPLGQGTNTSADGGPDRDSEALADSTADPQHLSKWTALHETVEQLEPDEKELFGLMWYHEMSLKDAAQVLDMSERTAKRRWRELRLKLRESLTDED